jgi:electron transfer flavoprotein alpha subunit
MRPLVYVEDRDGEPTADSLGAVSKAADLAGDTAAVLCGAGVTPLGRRVRAAGAAHVYVVDDPALSAPLPQPRVDVLAGLVREHGFETVLFATSSLATDVAGALANRLQAGLNWDLVDLEVREGELVGRRLALQDTVLVEVGWRGSPRLALVRPAAFSAGPGERTDSGVEAYPAAVDAWSKGVRLVEQRADDGGASSLPDADLVVAGGRGLGGAHGFELLEELAEALGAAVGASLPAVEIGWHPRSALVGQSGTSVAPRLYLACGISGAIQHKLGMQNAGTIVAINTDPHAPIFGFSDLAVVGDVYEIVPKLTELVRARKQKLG